MQCVHKKILRKKNEDKIRTPSLSPKASSNQWQCFSLPSRYPQYHTWACPNQFHLPEMDQHCQKKSVQQFPLEGFQLDRKAKILGAQLGPKSIHDTVYLDIIGFFIAQIDFWLFSYIFYASSHLLWF